PTARVRRVKRDSVAGIQPATMQPAGDLTRPLAKLIAGDGSIAGAKDDVAARLEQRLRQRAGAQPPAEHLDALGHAAKNDRSARAGHGGPGRLAALPQHDRAERDPRE